MPDSLRVLSRVASALLVLASVADVTGSDHLRDEYVRRAVELLERIGSRRIDAISN